MENPGGQTDSALGLKRAILSENETLAQSIALIAPTAAPLATIPLVYGSAGNGTWLTFVLSALIIVLVALNVNQFARISASPGSLYSYISSHMHPIVGMLAAWALLIAYIGTATSIGAGLTNYANVVLKSLFGLEVPPLLICAVGVSIAICFAYRDVTLSARLMLGLEAASVVLIASVAIGVLWKNGFHLDMAQIQLKGVSGDKLRMGLVLALFCSVGFESATSLGAEAREPLKSIPRAVKWSGILAGLFFIFCAYSEVLGFRGETETLDKSVAPMNVLARNAGMPAVVGVLISVGGLVSFFSCVLACLTASARVLYLMGQKGALHSLLGKAHSTNQTPHRAVFVSGFAVFLPLGVLLWRGTSALDIFGLLGTLATFGFLTAYFLVCLAAPVFLRAERRLTFGDALISGSALVVMALAFLGNIYPAPPPPYSYLPYIYLVLLSAGLVWSLAVNSGTARFSDDLSGDLNAVVE